LEGALAGKSARQRLAQLRVPPYSPAFTLWLVIGFLFYAMCFVILRHILTAGLVLHSQVFALVLTIVLLLANALWSVLFFRWRDLRASFIAFSLMQCSSPHWSSFSPGHIFSATSCFRVTAFILSMLLDGAIIYIDLTLQTPNQAMQRTASSTAFYFMRVCHPHLDCESCFTGLAVADLVSR
jgi:hypothetical protein